ncbi:hypothetical protein GCM10027569_19670 [Flindersiella endophytica]
MIGASVQAYTALMKGKRLLAAGGWPAMVEALPPKPDGPAALDFANVRSVADACARAARRLPVGTACLERSYATCTLLRRQGVPSLFCVGVSRFPPMRFHAWVEVDGQVLNEAQPIHEIYRTICSL